ncbi:unnamed protein product [Phyllotreta striolata]|uniref:Kinesin motor domain-containing protein n=1 Tax=Phyllotreta striolata TaxID=444603 RepID=A0A9N9XJ30_PHYSR|nr:unnamed protein product [Phyllotreta striolata]
MTTKLSLSYLTARDPSILAFNRFNVPKTQLTFSTKMDSTFTVSSTVIEEEQEHVNVFLKIRSDVDFNDENYEVSDKNFIVKKMHNLSLVKNVYSFSNIFHKTQTQEEIFNSVVKPKILDFLNGKNYSLFTYGASGSGKTYTIVGSPETPGIIPRSLDYTFRSIAKLIHEPTVMPLPNGTTIVINDAIKKEMESLKNCIMSSTAQVNYKDLYKQMQCRLSSENICSVSFDNGTNVSIWVSFVEIYNECIYDLLSKEKDKRLKLGSTGNDTYVKDLTQINVRSASEAFMILQYGLNKLNYAKTNVNMHSSRSHCIFTLKLVQTSKNNRHVIINNINFCDLAGSERLKKTLNRGSRLKESNNINTSLLVLGKCVDIVRNNQNKQENKLIPFRESKLTQIFQKALIGSEKMAIIININPSSEMLFETHCTLKFSAIAKSIVIHEQIPEVKLKKNRLSRSLRESLEGLENSDKFNLQIEESMPYRLLKLRFDDIKKSNEKLQEKYDDLRVKYEDLRHKFDNEVMELSEVDSLVKMEKAQVAENYSDALESEQKRHLETVSKITEEYEDKLTRYDNIFSTFFNSNYSPARPSVVYLSDSSDDDSDFVEDYSKEELIRIIKKNKKTCEEYKRKAERMEMYRELYRKIHTELLKLEENCDDVSFCD